MIERIAENLMFVQGMDSYSHYFAQLPDEHTQELRTYLLNMKDAEDDDEINQWIDRITSFGMQHQDIAPWLNTLQEQAVLAREPLIKTVLAEQQTNDLPTEFRHRMLITDPITFQPREAEINLQILGGNPQAAMRDKITAITQRLAKAIDGLPKESDAIDPGKDEPESAMVVKSYPNLQGDNYAYVKEVYELTVKLLDQPQELGDQGFDISVNEGEETKIIQVQLYCSDFKLAQDDSKNGWQRNLNFYVKAAASDAVTFKLVAKDHSKARKFVPLRLKFVVQGQLIGEAFHWVEVLENHDIEPSPLETFPSESRAFLDEHREIPWRPLQSRNQIGLDIYRCTDEQIHLTITIEPLRDEDEKFRWTFTSPYLEDRLPEGESPDLGRKQFVGKVLAKFTQSSTSYHSPPHMDKKGFLHERSIPTLRGQLKQLRYYAPKQFWDVYNRALLAHEEQGHDPKEFTILFRTNDCHIPWELMPTVDDTSADVLPLLGSIHRVGRWLQGVEPFVPSPTLNLHGFALVAPTYVNNKLPEAQKERQFLQERYDANPVINKPQQFRAFLKNGQPTGGTGILHFTGHGDCCDEFSDDRTRQSWLVLADGENKDWFDIYAASDDSANKLGKLGKDVIAFFNACNVGRNVKGPLNNGGWGRVLLQQKYRGYIGPLWNVNDNHACEVATTFYKLALDDKIPLGEVMRQIRQKFSQDNRLLTYIAYLYLGHPLTKINYTSPLYQDENISQI